MSRYSIVATLCLGACLGPYEQIVVEASSIQSDTTWTNEVVHVLEEDQILYVEGDATLTIEEGTEIRGRPGSALIVSRDARINARGSSDQPIVFTSDQPVGTRRPGDWGGVVLLGNGELNKSAPRQIEGIAGDEPRAQYGGTDAFSDCGAMQYVRIEFAGFELTDGADGNELNGLTLGGCGVNTFIRHVQVHRGLDDGIELFGGDVDLKFVVISGAGDDSLDWDEGWNGRVQFAVIQQLPQHPDPAVEKNGDEGMEGDGALIDSDLVGAGVANISAPYSFPTMSNVTLLGSADPRTAQSAMHLKEGTAALLINFLVAHQTDRGVDIEDTETAAWDLDDKAALPLVLRDSSFFSIGETTENWASEDDEDNDGGFDEFAWLRDQAFDNRFGQDVALPTLNPDGTWQTDPTPLWVPGPKSIAAQAGDPPTQEFFDGAATYAGAIRPGSNVAWWDGWTAFPLE